MATVVHVTHEAVQQSGGIGAVLRGLLAAPSYAAAIDRTILLGPLADPDAAHPLGVDGEVVFDSGRGIWDHAVGPVLDAVAARHGVRLVYGRRQWSHEGGQARPEVVLVDVSHAPAGFDLFKYYLSERFGIDSRRYEWMPEYEHYLRLSEPGLDAIGGLLGLDAGPCYLVAHEFMGMGPVLKALMMGDRRYRTLFYAHEVATVRSVVESAAGGEVMFYGALARALARGLYLEDVFGSQDHFHKHVLVRQAWRFDGILAVGDRVVEELRFLGPEFAQRPIDVVYNGLPARAPTATRRLEAGARLRDYLAGLLGFAPDWVMTHVARLVPSKGLHRDLMVLSQLDRYLAERGETAAVIILATETGRRLPADVTRMATAYGWPLVHREGTPDLSPGEIAFDLRVRAFNARARAVRAVFVNQFGWSRSTCGPDMPAEMTFDDLRCGTDVEFGLSLYEPFGIALLEPLAAGAVCVVGDACGCLGFVDRVSPGRSADAVVRGGYIERAPESLEAALSLDAAALAQIEMAVSQRLADELANRLRRRRQAGDEWFAAAAGLAGAMGWDEVAAAYFLPALQRL
jgi:glycosyltransferase involved in cell wall biosynthesis